MSLVYLELFDDAADFSLHLFNSGDSGEISIGLRHRGFPLNEIIGNIQNNNEGELFFNAKFKKEEEPLYIQLTIEQMEIFKHFLEANLKQHYKAK